MLIDPDKPCVTVDGRAIRDLERVNHPTFGDCLRGFVERDTNPYHRFWNLDGSHVHNGHGLDILNVVVDMGSFDPNKPFKTRDGRDVLNFRRWPDDDALWVGDVAGERPGKTRLWELDGTHRFGDNNLDLVNGGDEKPRVLTRGGEEVFNLRPETTMGDFVWRGEADGRSLTWTAEGRWSASGATSVHDIVSGLPGQPVKHIDEAAHQVAEALSETPAKDDPHRLTHKAEFEAAILSALGSR